jgi:dihydrofolate synthase/folylpolyglutamate synthase
MNYTQATYYIQNLNRFGMKLGLERVERLLEFLGNPQRNFRSILIGGTSGKGSTTVMIGSILKEAGYKTGVFTKPHLFDFRERISVGGEMISERDFVRLVGRIRPLAEKMHGEGEGPTFFEFVTAMAFEYFREKKVEIAVLEVGLGGRLDATNAVNPEISVITNVSLEHTEILGDTVGKIAAEKAGIIKKGGILITGSQNPNVLRILKEICTERKARFVIAPPLKNAESFWNGNAFDLTDKRVFVPMAGRYQLGNIACALEAIRSLGEEIPAGAIKKGLENARWPGRFEMVNESPKVLLDGAKDVEAMKSLAGSLGLLKYDKLYTVFGVSECKLVDKMIKEIARKTDFFVLTKHKVMNRGVEPLELAKEVEKTGKTYIVVEDVKNAVRKTMELAGKDDLVLVTGSLFTVAEARELWFKNDARIGRQFNENVKPMK